MRQEGALKGCQRAVAVRETLDRLDSSALHLAHRHQAAADLLAVEKDRAGAAIAGVAADLGADEAQRVAQGRGQARGPGTSEFGGAAVQGESHRHATNPFSKRRSRVSPTSRR